VPFPELERRAFAEVKAEADGRLVAVAVERRQSPGLADAEVADAIDRAFGEGAIGSSPIPAEDPDPDELLALVGRCEAAGFEIHVWLERVEHHDRKVVDWVRRLSIRDPDGRRRPPDRLVLPIMVRSRIICGYLVRIRSAFFADPATDDDRRLAMECSIADDRRLRQHGR
jgi:hypothetical protein